MSVQECRDLNELHPKVKELAEKLLDECKKQGLNIKNTETYRTVERQDYLYAQGRTSPGNIVTNAKGSDKSSYHQWRLAFDVCVNDPKNLYDEVILRKVGAIGKKLGLEWGGDWTSPVDLPHFQYTFGLTIKDLKSGAKIPDYNPNEKKCVITQQEINLNGSIRKVNTVMIDGNNYVKLRDISDDKLHIDYDSKNKMPIITCKK